MASYGNSYRQRPTRSEQTDGEDPGRLVDETEKLVEVLVLCAHQLKMFDDRKDAQQVHLVQLDLQRPIHLDLLFVDTLDEHKMLAVLAQRSVDNLVPLILQRIAERLNQRLWLRCACLM